MTVQFVRAWQLLVLIMFCYEGVVGEIASGTRVGIIMSSSQRRASASRTGKVVKVHRHSRSQV